MLWENSSQNNLYQYFLSYSQREVSIDFQSVRSVLFIKGRHFFKKPSNSVVDSSPFQVCSISAMLSNSVSEVSRYSSPTSDSKSLKGRPQSIDSIKSFASSKWPGYILNSHRSISMFPPFLEFAIIVKIYQKHHIAKMISRFFSDSVKISFQYHIVFSIFSYYVCLKYRN